MIDAEPVDKPRSDELQHLRMSRLEDVGILDPDAAEPSDVEEAPEPATFRIPVEETRAQLRVGPELILLLRGRHVVRNDIHDRTQTGGAYGLEECPQLSLAAKLLRNPGRID